MNHIQVIINDEVKIDSELTHTDPGQLLKSIEGMIKFSEQHKGSAFKMAKGLKGFLRKG